MSRRWGRLPVALALLATTVAWGQERQTWVGFGWRLHYWPEQAELAQTVAEAAGTSLPRLETALGLKLRAPVDMYLAHTGAEFRQLTGGEDPNQVLGAALEGQRRVVLQPLTGERLRGLVAHELTHLALADATAAGGGEAPRWLHEGLAQYASGEFTPSDRLLLIKAVNEGGFLPLPDLEQAFEGPPEKVALAYAEAYTLVDFLATRAGDEGLTPLLRQLAQVGDANRAILRTYGLTPDQLAQEWRRHLIHEYVGRSTQEQATPLIWAGMVLVFAAAVVIRLRHAALIRRRLEAEERESDSEADEGDRGEPYDEQIP